MNDELIPWFKYYGDIPHHLDYPEQSLFQALDEVCREHPNVTAYDFMGKPTDYTDFRNSILDTARAFNHAGIKKDDKVTIALPNIPQGLWCFYGLSRLGAVPNMVHPLSAPAEIAFYLKESKSKMIICLDMFYKKVETAVRTLKNPVTIIVCHIEDQLEFPKKNLYRLKVRKKRPDIHYGGMIIDWNDFYSSGYDDKLPIDQTKGSDVGVILYSGGTTGTTKGILLSSDNMNATARQTIAASGVKFVPGLKMLSIMPMFHGFGLGIGIHTAFLFAGTCILVPQFSIKEYAKVLKTKKPNFIPGVPTLFEALLRAKGLKNVNLSFLMGVFSGGDSLPVSLKRKVDAFLKKHGATVQIREGYGTTECVTASCLTPPTYNREGSIGVPFPDTYFCITEPNGTTALKAGEEGEICLRGPSVMIGYMDNPEETANVLKLHDDGCTWLHTGDLGLMDDDGFVYFKQRIKRMIVTSGYNVYPSQVENVISSNPKVLNSCVIGVPDPYKMQKVKAFVVLRPGFIPDEAVKSEIMNWCKSRIAKYSMPYDIEFRDELPKTLVGKVAYRILEEEETTKVKANAEDNKQPR